MFKEEKSLLLKVFTGIEVTNYRFKVTYFLFEVTNSRFIVTNFRV